MSKEIVITGAGSYTGRYIAQQFIKKGCKIRNFTNRPIKAGLFKPDSQISTFPLKFPNYEQGKSVQPYQPFVRGMDGAETLFLTYWVRFDNYAGFSRKQVIFNTQTLVESAKQAKVKKIVYTSHTQTSLDSPIPYIRGKAEVQQYIRESGISYGFVKPCAIFGRTPRESILMNNLSYLIRKSPIFPIVGDGLYPLQPVHVQDMAQLCIQMSQTESSGEVDAVGPEKFNFIDLIRTTAQILNTKCHVIKNVPASLCFNLSKIIDLFMKDKLIDRTDLDLMLLGLTQSHNPPTGKRKYTEWVEEHKETLGREWNSTLKRYYKT